MYVSIYCVLFVTKLTSVQGFEHLLPGSSLIYYTYFTTVLLCESLLNVLLLQYAKQTHDVIGRNGLLHNVEKA